MKQFFVKMTLSVCSAALLLGAGSAVWADNAPQNCPTKKCAVCPKGPECGQTKKCGPAKRKCQKSCRASESVAKQLCLTPEQCEKAAPSFKKFDETVQKIAENKRSHFDKVLTDQQREQIKNKREDNGKSAMRCEGKDKQDMKRDKSCKIELTEQQKAELKKYNKADKEEMKKAFQTLKADLNPILTDEQKSKLESMKVKDCFRAPKKDKHKGKKHQKRERCGSECRGMSPERGAHMGGGLPPFIIDELDLSQEQEAKVKDICRKYDEARRQRLEKMRQSDKDDFELMMKEVSSVLNDQQKAKLAEIKERRPHDGPHGHSRD
ncbi:MAG: hypothetical protein ACI376_00165 [Candidatus Bruticola sp.]